MSPTLIVATRKLLFLCMYVHVCMCVCWPLLSNQSFFFLGKLLHGYVMGVDDHRVG